MGRIDRMMYVAITASGEFIVCSSNIKDIAKKTNKTAEELMDDLKHKRRCVATLEGDEAKIVLIREMGWKR